MIQISRDGQVAIIRLNRPEKKNALTPAMLDQLASAIASSTGAKALIVCGSGDVFCSGFDLAMCLDHAEVLAQLLQGLNQVIMVLRQHSAPVVAAAQGAAIAGGCALLGGADVVVTNREAKLGYPVTPLGISPAVSAPFLSVAVGSGATRTRLLEPRLISGEDAFRIELVHECVAEASEVFPRALAIAKDLAEKPRSGMEATKAWLNELDGTLDISRGQQALAASLSLVGSAEERERLAKFLKR